MTRRELLALGAVLAPGAWSQSTDLDLTLPSGKDLVVNGNQWINVMATVRSENTNALVNGLTPADFRIFEDGKEQIIRDFGVDPDLPVTVGMLIGISSGMVAHLPEIKIAGARFFRSVLRSQDQAFAAAAFHANLDMLQDVTSKPEDLEEGLDRMRYSANPRDGTALFDAIDLACEWHLTDPNGRKILLILCDDVDSGSRKSLDDVIKTALGAETIIYSIAYPPDMKPDVHGTIAGGFGRGGAFGGGAVNSSGMVMDPKGPEKILKPLAEETGGRLFTKPKSARLDDIFKEIQEEIRAQYSIAYAQPNPEKRDGKFRRIEVRALDKRYTVRARKGYYTAKQ